MLYKHCVLIFVIYISDALLQSISHFPSHVRMQILLPALNLKLSVAPSAPIIANYLLQPQATCRLCLLKSNIVILQTGL